MKVSTYKLVLALLSTGLAACAGPTGYTERDPLWGSAYGYSVKRIGDDEFSVVVSGNPLTSAERVAQIALLRAARLAQEHGRTHFIVLKQSTETLATQRLHAIPVFFPGLPLWIPVGETAREEPFAVLLIRLLPESAPTPPDALEAAAIITRLSGPLGAE